MAVIMLKNIGFSIFGLIIALLVLSLAPINSAKGVDQSAIGPNHSMLRVVGLP
jgi:hypothetical protein